MAFCCSVHIPRRHSIEEQVRKLADQLHEVKSLLLKEQPKYSHSPSPQEPSDPVPGGEGEEPSDPLPGGEGEVPSLPVPGGKGEEPSDPVPRGKGEEPSDPELDL